MARFILRQTLVKAVQDWTMNHPIRVIDWTIDPYTEQQDEKGMYVRVGSWTANHWFHVAKGKTEKQTLSYAKQHLARTTRVKTEKFEYIEEQ